MLDLGSNNYRKEIYENHTMWSVGKNVEEISTRNFKTFIKSDEVTLSGWHRSAIKFKGQSAEINYNAFYHDVDFIIVLIEDSDLDILQVLEEEIDPELDDIRLYKTKDGKLPIFLIVRHNDEKQCIKIPRREVEIWCNDKEWKLEYLNAGEDIEELLDNFAETVFTSGIMYKESDLAPFTFYNTKFEKQDSSKTFGYEKPPTSPNKSKNRLSVFGYTESEAKLKRKSIINDMYMSQVYSNDVSFKDLGKN